MSLCNLGRQPLLDKQDVFAPIVFIDKFMNQHSICVFWLKIT